jgi:hypothetical protein
LRQQLILLLSAKETTMSLTVNWQPAMASDCLFTSNAGLAGKTGKLNIGSARQNSSSLPTDPAQAAGAGQKITMEDFLSALRNNLPRPDRKDENGEAGEVEPLVNAFASTIKQLEEAYGKSVADMAMAAITRGIEAGGGSDRNMTGVLSEVFNKIALDPTLKGKNIELNKKMTGRTLKEDDNWRAEGLTRMLNSGLDFYAPGQPGLAKALGDFYFTGQNDNAAGKKFTLNWNEAEQAYEVRLVAHASKSEITAASGDMAGRQNPESLRPLNYPPEAYADGRQYGDLKPEWYLATKMAFLTAQLNPGQGSGNMMEAITGIVNGDPEYKPTDKMLAAIDLYARYLEDKNSAWTAINEFRRNHWDAFKGLSNLDHLSENELAEYETLSNNWFEVNTIYNRKSDKLYAEILADMKKF